MGESSRVALISTSFGSIEALGVGISGMQLETISIKSSVCAFSFYAVILFLYNYVMFKQIV